MQCCWHELGFCMASYNVATCTSMHIVTSSGSEMFWAGAAAWQDTVKSRFVSWSCKKSTLRRVLPWRPNGRENPGWLRKMIHNISQHFKINVYHCLSYLMRTNNVATQAKMEKQIRTWKHMETTSYARSCHPFTSWTSWFKVFKIHRTHGWLRQIETG